MFRRGCRFKDCEAPAHKLDLCHEHFLQYWDCDGDFSRLVSLRRLCAIGSCREKAFCRGMCRKCYRREIGAGRITVKARKQRLPCSFPNCGRAQDSRGYCKTHAAQLVRYGSPGLLRPIRVFGARRNPVCRFSECGRQVTAKQYCRAHYEQLRRFGYDHSRLKSLAYRGRVRKDCKVPNCDRPSDARGICAAHYAYLRRHGFEGNVVLRPIRISSESLRAKSVV